MPDTPTPAPGSSPSDDLGRLLDRADRGFRDDRFDDSRLNASYGLAEREVGAVAERPLAEVVFADERPLASVGSRLLAHVVDGLIGAVPVLVFIVGVFVLEEDGSASGAVMAFAGGAALLALLIYQLWLLGTVGQTIGKRAMKVRIVDAADGSNPGFGRAVGVRGVLNGLIASVPYLGTLYWIADVLFIFREDRRCLHDHLAKTIVVSEA